MKSVDNFIRIVRVPFHEQYQSILTAYNNQQKRLESRKLPFLFSFLKLV